MSVVAVIPARGGSKGIPEKNLRSVGGRSLVARAILAAERSSSVDAVLVSSDSLRVLHEARAAGAVAVERPAVISGDEAGSESAVLHALDAWKEQNGRDPDIVVFMQCTSPFTQPTDIDRAVSEIRNGADVAFTVSRSHAFLWEAGEGGLEAVNHEADRRVRRQDRTAQFVETGAVYAMRTPGFREGKHRFFGDVRMVEVPRERSLEIDDPIDLVVARAIAATCAVNGVEVALTGLRDIRGAVFDFDGVFTDNGVWLDQHGVESVRCDRSDGLGIERLREAGLSLLVLSAERNPVVSRRTEKLNVETRRASQDKVGELEAWSRRVGVDLASTVYVGNDVNDVDCMRAVGASFAPADAHEAAISVATAVLRSRGGAGAVREVSDAIIDELRRRDG